MSKKSEILNCYKENGICLYEYPEINGIKQYIQIRGADKKAPLLLFLHGGPGGSMAGLCHVMQNEWEKKFTVVNWDQRNTCKTLLANKSKASEIAKTGALSDYINDIDAIIKYLHTVYTFEKIILVGFSWGSVIGCEYAKKHPENVSHYIGIGQNVNYIKGLEYSCDWLKKEAESGSSDTQIIDTLLQQISKKPEMNAELMKSIQSLSFIGSKYIAKNARPFPVKELLKSPFLKFKEKKAMLKSDFNLLVGTYKTLINYDFTDNLKFEVPVLFVNGDEDFACPVELLKQCFEDIKAPEKKMVTIPSATHLCFYDKPDEFFRILSDFVS